MCHSVPHKHLIYSNSSAWPVSPSPYPSDPSVFHFPLTSIQSAGPWPYLEPLDRDWHSSLFLHHILCWKKKWPSDQRTEPALSPVTGIWKHFQSFAPYTHSNALMWSALGLLWAFFFPPANSLLTFQACTSPKTRLRQGPEYSIGKSPRAEA